MSYEANIGRPRSGHFRCDAVCRLRFLHTNQQQAGGALRLSGGAGIQGVAGSIQQWRSGAPRCVLPKIRTGKSADDVIPFRNQTGGFELLDILNSEGLHLEFVVRERRSDIRAVGSLHVKEAEPGEVTAFTLRAIPQGASLTDVNFKIDAATRSRVIDNAISNLNEFYVFPEVARWRKVSERVRGAVNMI
jgi:hypothetical protein